MNNTEYKIAQLKLKQSLDDIRREYGMCWKDLILMSTTAIEELAIKYNLTDCEDIPRTKEP